MKYKYPEYFVFEQSKKERDLIAELENTKSEFHKELSKFGYNITEELFINGTRNIQQKGKPTEWSYCTWYQKEKNGKTFLRCSVGFTQTGKQHDISIPVQTIKRI